MAQTGEVVPGGQQAPQPPMTPEELAESTARAEEFLRDHAPYLGRLFGIDLNISVGDHWATTLTGPVPRVTADAKFFIERGYDPEDATYATLHEIVAHLRERINEPRLTQDVVVWHKRSNAHAIFHNILADVAGNRMIHAMLPAMAQRAEHLYSTRLFPEADYQTIPRHLQFLYSIIRTAMIPGSTTAVLPEVEEAIAELRDYQGQGDIIDYSTAPAKTARTRLTGRERFDLWTQAIFPVYERLIELDRQDPNMQQQDSDGDGSDGQEGDEWGDPQDAYSSPYDQPSDDKRFGKHYREYQQNRHADPFSDEDEEAIDEYAKRCAEANQQSDWEKIARDRERELDHKLRAETGHTLAEQRRYDQAIVDHHDAIDEMREVYQRVIQRGIAQRRVLSRNTMPDGALLDPDRLAQTVADVMAGIEEPDAFRDYVRNERETDAVGNTDYFFVIDRSSSMQGERARAAANATLVAIEGLAAMERDARRAEEEHGIDLDLSVRSSIYVFSDHYQLVKPLSPTLSTRERLDTYAAVLSPDGNTADYAALEAIAALPVDPNRRRFVVVITDGESNVRWRAERALDALRAKGYEIFGIGIGSDEATDLYRPNARRVDNARELPSVMAGYINGTLS